MYYLNYSEKKTTSPRNVVFCFYKTVLLFFAGISILPIFSSICSWTFSYNIPTSCMRSIIFALIVIIV